MCVCVCVCVCVAHLCIAKGVIIIKIQKDILSCKK